MPYVVRVGPNVCPRLSVYIEYRIVGDDQLMLAIGGRFLYR